MRLAHRLARDLLRNALRAIPTIFVIVTLGFFLLQLAPGDAVDYIAAEDGAATQATMAHMRDALGLDLPMLTQLVNYYATLASGSLGVSPRFGVPVTQMIFERLPQSLLLMGTAIAVALLAGLAGGTVMALRAGTATDRLLSALFLLFYSVPAFLVGLFLILLFSVTWRWLPAGGMQTIGGSLSGWDWFVDRARYLVLPALALASYYIAIYSRLTRAAVLDVKDADHVRTAIAKGIAPGRIVRRHVLRNALMPVSTAVGMHVGGILGGAVVVETVFGWPGMGRLTYEAIMGREYTVILGILLVSSILVILANTLADVVQSVLDPRIGSR